MRVLGGAGLRDDDDGLMVFDGHLSSHWPHDRSLSRGGESLRYKPDQSAEWVSWRADQDAEFERVRAVFGGHPG